MVIRSRTSKRIDSPKVTTLDRPPRLARYIAASALESSVAASSTPKVLNATPTDALEEDLGPVDHEGSRQTPSRTFDEGRCPHRRGTPVTDEEREELVSTEARDQLRFAGDPHQPLGHQGKEEITGFVTHRVVDRLEAVDIEQDHRDDTGGAPPGCHRARQPCCETRAVGKTGQRIVQILTRRSRSRGSGRRTRVTPPTLLGRTALGDEAAHGPFGSRPGREQAAPGDDPVPGLVDELELPVRPAIAADPPVVTDVRERRDPKLCRQHRFVHAKPDDFVAAPPEDAFGLRVPLGHHACGIDLDVGLGTERDQSSETFVSRPELRRNRVADVNHDGWDHRRLIDHRLPSDPEPVARDPSARTASAAW